MTINSLPDIVPNGSTVPLSATTRMAIWVILMVNGTSIHIGDSQVGASRGINPATKNILTLPRVSFEQGGIDLAQIYVYGAAGTDSVSVIFGA